MTAEYKRAFAGATSGLLMALAVEAGAAGDEIFDCVIQPTEVVELSSSVSGIIGTIDVDRSDPVEKDQVVAQLQSDVEQAQVELSRQRAGFDGEIVSKRASLAFAKRKQQRTQKLFNKKAVPFHVLDEAKTDAVLAATELRNAEQNKRMAELELERTHIVAPFAGRVLRKLADLGQVVSPNTQLAEIYATDVVEIRLPIRNRDLPFIDLPESYRFGNVSHKVGGQVQIHSDLGGEESWDATLIRTEGAIDETARQLHVIAQIEDPFGRGNEDHAPLKIGQYVTARLEGKTIPGALVIPNNTIYQGTYVYIVEDEILRRRNIEIAWQNDAEAVVGAGLRPGDLLVTTALGQVTSGIRVSVVGEEGERRMGRNLQEVKK